MAFCAARSRGNGRGLSSTILSNWGGKFRDNRFRLAPFVVEPGGYPCAFEITVMIEGLVENALYLLNGVSPLHLIWTSPRNTGSPAMSTHSAEMCPGSR